MKLHGLAKIAYQVVPKCEYKLIGTDLVATPLDPEGDCRELYDERGVFIGHDKTDTAENKTIKGVLTGLTKEQIVWVPEGGNANAYATFTTDVSLPLAGTCTVDMRSRWLIETEDGAQYMFKARKKRGCLYTYLIEDMCGPDCE